jgi:hypothetical protein
VEETITLPRLDWHDFQPSVEFFHHRCLMPCGNRFSVVSEGEFTRMMPQRSLHVRNVALEQSGESGTAHAEGEIRDFGCGAGPPYHGL